MQSDETQCKPQTPQKQGVYIRTFGCQMNEYDSQKLYKILEKDYQPVDAPEKADTSATLRTAYDECIRSQEVISVSSCVAVAVLPISVGAQLRLRSFLVHLKHRRSTRLRTRSQVDVIELTNAVMANPRSFELSLVANPELAQLLFTEMAKQSVLKLEAALAQLSPVPAEVKHSLLPMDMAAVAKSMGMNFIGPEQWKGNFGADVGVAPPIPTEITEALLESDCPIAPGRKVKDTHILVLVPETMDGKPYTALAFGNYCLSRARSDETPLLRIPRYSGCWNTKPWASQPQSESEWVLTPKVFMARTGPKERQFLDKGIVEQEAIYATHYSSEYRPARALEMMTAALLSEFINRLDTRNYKESYLIGRGFNCSDRTSEGFPVCVGPFNSDGLAIYNSTDVGDFQIGFALARRL